MLLILPLGLARRRNPFRVALHHLVRRVGGQTSERTVPEGGGGEERGEERFQMAISCGICVVQLLRL